MKYYSQYLTLVWVWWGFLILEMVIILGTDWAHARNQEFLLQVVAVIGVVALAWVGFCLIDYRMREKLEKLPTAEEKEVAEQEASLVARERLLDRRIELEDRQMKHEDRRDAYIKKVEQRGGINV